MEGLFTLLMYIFSLCFVIFWMVVGWRIMRAHEDLADSIDRISRKKYWQEQQPKLYKDD